MIGHDDVRIVENELLNFVVVEPFEKHVDELERLNSFDDGTVDKKNDEQFDLENIFFDQLFEKSIGGVDRKVFKNLKNSGGQKFNVVLSFPLKIFRVFGDAARENEEKMFGIESRVSFLGRMNRIEKRE